MLIIGGSDAGISGALRVQELNCDAQIDMLLADDFPNYSICGLPFYLSGETPDWHSLAHRTRFDGITIHRCQEATKIDALGKKVLATDREGKVVTHHYDKLVIATGAAPVAPLSSPWEPVQMAAHRWAANLRLEKVEEMCKQ
jgi:NADPH-dependent 2,4-dienoyl-CoA reductase/sulfur reductase-like enzyme